MTRSKVHACSRDSVACGLRIFLLHRTSFPFTSYVNLTRMIARFLKGAPKARLAWNTESLKPFEPKGNNFWAEFWILHYFRKLQVFSTKNKQTNKFSKWVKDKTTKVTANGNKKDGWLWIQPSTHSRAMRRASVTQVSAAYSAEECPQDHYNDISAS